MSAPAPPRSVWIDAGNNPNLPLLAPYGVKRCYWPTHVIDRGTAPVRYVRNPTLTMAYLESWRTGTQIGLYAAANWFGGDVLEMVRELDAMLTLTQQTARQCAVHANIEKGMVGGTGASWANALVDFMRVFRAVRPLRELCLVVDSLQGGNLTRDVITDLLYYNVDLMAEAFAGNMDDYGADNARSNLVNFGVPLERAFVCYDAARLTPGTFWIGNAFTQGRFHAVTP